MRSLIFRSSFAVLICVAAIVRADESKVGLGEVPTAGLDAVKAMFPDARVVGAAKETDEGKTVFEITLKHKGRTIDVTLSTAGKIEVIEKEIAEKDLPKVVREALDQKYPKATYKIVEQVDIMKDGKPSLDFFEALLVLADKQKLEVKVAPDGTIKGEEKKDAGKDE